NGSGVGRGVKEKQVLIADKSVVISKHVNLALGSNVATRNPNVVDIVNNVANNGTMVGPTPVGNTPGRSTLYANVTGEPSRKALNFRTVFTLEGNEVDVAIPVESFRAISERFANTTYGFFLGKRVSCPVSSISLTHKSY
ncbi:hypothetical protein Tco_1470683, partial [Tanacetum coccineum]